MTTIPSSEPTSFTAGETVQWTRLLTDYSPDNGWTLKYAFVTGESGESDQQVITAENNGDGSFIITISATDSAYFKPAVYAWQAFVSKSGERKRVDSGRVTVEPDFEILADGYDHRHPIKRILDAIEGLVEDLASHGQGSLSVAGRNITWNSPEQLIAWRSFYEAKWNRVLAQEAVDRGDPNPMIVQVALLD